MNYRSLNKTKIIFLFLGGMSALLLICLAALYLFIAPARYKSAVHSNAEEFGLDSRLVYAVIRTESNFRADARSKAGAIGLMQITPLTAEFIRKSMGEPLDPEQPEENIRMGCWYLRYLSEKFSGMAEILSAYNAGEGTVRSWLAREELLSESGTLQQIPYPETRQYVQRVKNFYNCYKLLYD